MLRLWCPLIADTFCQNLPPIGIPILACGLGYSTLRRKIPPCSLSLLERGFHVIGVLFLAGVSPAFLPSKKAYGIHKFPHFWGRQQYPILKRDTETDLPPTIFAEPSEN